MKELIDEEEVAFENYYSSLTAHIRQVLKDYGWQQEPTFAGYVEEIIW